MEVGEGRPVETEITFPALEGLQYLGKGLPEEVISTSLKDENLARREKRHRYKGNPKEQRHITNFLV